MNVNTISFRDNFSGFKFSKNHDKSYIKYQNLKPLQKDTISFTSMKKSQFHGIDLAIINKFHPPIEKFNDNNDLQIWCMNKIDELKEKDLSARQDETTTQRLAAFEDWRDYVLNENDAYTNSISLLILDGILDDIKKDNDREIPVLDKGILAQTIDEINSEVKNNPKTQVNFNKLYRLNLQKMTLEDMDNNIDSSQTDWICIPSYKNDPINFSENVNRLKRLSYKSWCTASFDAEPYLKQGDFHIYLENGRPKLGVRFVKGKVKEIQGKKNNSKIPIKYLNVAQKYIKDNHYALSENAKSEFKQALIIKKEIKNIERKLKKQGVDFKTATPAQLFDVFNIKYEQDNDGMFIIEKYEQPGLNYSFDDMGIDENKLFKDVKEIRGDANFRNSQLTHLDNLETIGGNANFVFSKLTSLDNLQYIGRDADFKRSKLTSLNSLHTIGRNANFERSKLTSLNCLRVIGKNANFWYSQLTHLDNLQVIGGNAVFRDSELTNLDNLKAIGGNADFGYSELTSLDSLQAIGGDADFERSKLTSLNSLLAIDGHGCFRNSQLTHLDNLQYIRGNANFESSKLTSLDSLLAIGGNANFGSFELTSLNNLRAIGGDADFTFSQLAHLDSLQTIGGTGYFRNSRLTHLDSLKTIGGSGYFGCSQLTHLDNLQAIGKSAYFSYSKLTHLDNLQYIGGDADFTCSEITHLDNLKTIGGDADFRDSQLTHLKNSQIVKGHSWHY